MFTTQNNKDNRWKFIYMDVSNNGGRAQPTSHPNVRPQTTNQVYTNSEPAPHHKQPKNKFKIISLRTLFAILLIGIAVLLIALVAYVVNNTVKNEGSYVNKSSYQAVFVNVIGSSGGQAYFGHIQQINPQYVELTNVFYLESGTKNNQFTLNNLSCALYSPEDTMIIKTDQVLFWENLSSTSSVSKDISKWYADKLTCNSSSSTNQTGATTTTPGTSTDTTGTTGTTGTTDTTGTTGTGTTATH